MYEQDYTFGIGDLRNLKEKKKEWKNEQILAPYQCVPNAERIKHACDHVKDVKHFTGPYSASVSF